jgi:very-short-patch-repair endonuclease
VDFLWEDSNVIVEVDGRRSHATGIAFQNDRDRDSLLAANGYLTLRFTWWDVTRRPKVVAHRLRKVLASAE